MNPDRSKRIPHKYSRYSSPVFLKLCSAKRWGYLRAHLKVPRNVCNGSFEKLKYTRPFVVVFYLPCFFPHKITLLFGVL